MYFNPTPLTTLLVKPVGAACNCRCDYCFYLKTKRDGVPECRPMSNELLEFLIKNALDGGSGAFSFIWQGGEPTLAGLDFYQKAVALQKRWAPGRRIGNAMQTNGLRIDDAWAVFLFQHNFLTGLSLDGPEAFHDLFRRQRNGGGTWWQARNALNSLMKHGALCNILCCVTRRTQDEAAALYRFFTGLGCSHVQFIPVWESTSDGAEAPFSVTADGYGNFLMELFDIWLDDNSGNRLVIRQFETLEGMLHGAPPSECGSMEQCSVYLVAEAQGDIYPCDFFVHPVHTLGNVRRECLQDMFHAPKMRLFASAKAKLPPKCKSCLWLPLCRGGCLKYRRFAQRSHARTGGMPEYIFCEAMRRFYAHAVPRLAAYVPKNVQP